VAAPPSLSGKSKLIVRTVLRMRSRMRSRSSAAVKVPSRRRRHVRHTACPKEVGSFLTGLSNPVVLSQEIYSRRGLESRSWPTIPHRGCCHLNPLDPFYTAFSFASSVYPSPCGLWSRARAGTTFPLIHLNYGKARPHVARPARGRTPRSCFTGRVGLAE